MEGGIMTPDNNEGSINRYRKCDQNKANAKNRMRGKPRPKIMHRNANQGYAVE